MAINYEKLQIRLDIDTTQGLREITALQEKVDTLKKSAKTGNSTADRETAKKEADETQKLLDAEREKLGLVGMTLGELRRYYAQLAVEKRAFTQGTEQYNKVDEAMTTLGNRIKEVTSSQYNYQKSLRATVEQEGIHALSLTQLQEYQKLLKKDIEDTVETESEANLLRIQQNNEITAMIAQKKAIIAGANTDELEGLRLLIKDSGTATLSIRQLETASKQMYDEMIAGSKSGSIAEHALYKEWLHVNDAIKTAKEELDTNKVAQHAYNTELKETVKSFGIEALSLKQLKEYYKLLREEIEITTDFDSELNRQRIADAQKTEALLQEKQQKVNSTASFFENIKNAIPSAIAGAFGGAFVGIVGTAVEKGMQLITAGIDKIKERARDITEIATTLDISTGSAAKIKADLSSIRTETSVSELKNLVKVAGDLNVATKDIKSFVTASDQVGVVMKEEFASVEDGVTMIAKLRGEFEETKNLSFPETIQKIGSTLKELNLAGPATVKGINDFLARTGQLPSAIKPAITELAGLAAVFEEANLTSEIAASGYTKVLTTAANNTTMFAKQMKLSTQEVKNLINTNPNEFVLKFAESLRNLDGVETAGTLKALKLESDEVTKVMGVLSDNLFKVRDKQELANKAFTEGTRITSTFNKYLNDDAGQIAQLEKAYDKITTSMAGFMSRAVGPLLVGLAKLTETEKTATELYQEQRQKTDSLRNSANLLMQKYNEVLPTIKNNAKAQQELSSIMSQMGKIIPGVITQYDQFGRAISVNIGLVKEFIKEQEKAASTAKWTAINSHNIDNNRLGGERAEVQKQINFYRKQIEDNQKAFGKSSKHLYEDQQIAQLEQRLGNITKQIEDNKQSVKDLNTNQAITPETETKPPVIYDKNQRVFANTDNAKNEAAEREKFIQESAKREIELAAQLAFEKDQAYANDHQKAIQQLERNAELETAKIREQFKDKNGIVLEYYQLSKEQKDRLNKEEYYIDVTLKRNVLKTNKEFDDKRKEQLAKQVQNSVEIANTQKRIGLERQLVQAEESRNETAILKAKENLLDNSYHAELSKLKEKFEDEKRTLKGNKEAINQLKKNLDTEENIAFSKFLADRDKLRLEYKKAHAERGKASNRQRLELDIVDAQQNGGDVLAAQKALLENNMQLELSVKGLTEQEKTNITRRYTLERQALEKQSFMSIASEAIDIFGQAFSSVTGLFKQQLANRESEETSKYDSAIARIDAQEQAGTISKAKATADKTKLEKAHAKELSKIKYEQAKADKAANLAQAVMNGIQAVMKTFAETGFFGGILGASIMGAINAVNIATIASTPLPKIEGSFFDGGALPSYFSNPVDDKGGSLIIAHPDEFIIPKWIRKEPIFANIEPVVQHMISTGRSMYTGGAMPGEMSTITTMPAHDNSANDLLVQVLNKNIEVQEKLLTSLQTIEVVVGYEAAEKILDTANQMKSIKDSAKA